MQLLVIIIKSSRVLNKFTINYIIVTKIPNNGKEDRPLIIKKKELGLFYKTVFRINECYEVL